MKFIILFLVTITSILFMDMIWLGFIAKNIYAQNIGILLRKSGEAMTTDMVGCNFGLCIDYYRYSFLCPA